MRNSLILTAIILSSASFIKAQMPCGTKINNSTLMQLQDFYHISGQYRQINFEGQPYNIPLKIHVIRRKDGSGGLDTSLIPLIIDTLNYYYKNSMLEFYVCSTIEFINDKRFSNFEATEEEGALTLHDVPRMINIYFVDTLLTNNNEICGYAYMSGGPLEVFINNTCAISGNTVVHEIGHVFSLIHTHGSNNSELTKELVDGSNCLDAGDFICDTPADPNLSDKTTYYSQQDSCAYTGTVTDANADPFSPMINNIMAYVPSVCKPDTLTPQQYQRVYNAIFYYGLINTICSDESAFSDEIISVYPNPFFNELFILFDLQNRSLVALSMFDLLGNHIQSLFFDYLEPGRNKLYFSVDDNKLTKGLYFITLTVDGKTVDATKIVSME